jgi:hypothetical protein
MHLSEGVQRQDLLVVAVMAFVQMRAYSSGIQLHHVDRTSLRIPNTPRFSRSRKGL